MDIKAIAKLLGSEGGKATMRLHGRNHFSLIGKKGVEKRYPSKRLPAPTIKPSKRLLVVEGIKEVVGPCSGNWKGTGHCVFKATSGTFCNNHRV